MKKVVQGLKNRGYHLLLIILSIRDLIKSLEYFTQNKIKYNLLYLQKRDLLYYLHWS
jgi:hypothetical protein